MKINVKNLIELIRTLPPQEFLKFIEKYENESRANPFLHKHLHQRLRQKPFEYAKDEISCEPFFKDTKELFEILDSCSKEARDSLSAHIKTIHLLYGNLIQKDLEKYLNNLETLDSIGIDNIVFGFNYNNHKQRDIISSNNLKIFKTKKSGRLVDSLKICSNGIIQKASLAIQKKGLNQTVACTFNLDDPTFILEISNDDSNILYLLGSYIDLDSISKIDTLDSSFEFTPDIEQINSQINFESDFTLSLDYPSLNGKTPKHLYKH